MKNSTLTIVGVGLLGGSIALAAKERGLAGTIVGVGRDPDRLTMARDAGLIDEIGTDLVPAAARSDAMVFCTPVDEIARQVCVAANAPALPGVCLPTWAAPNNPSSSRSRSQVARMFLSWEATLSPVRKNRVGVTPTPSCLWIAQWSSRRLPSRFRPWWRGHDDCGAILVLTWWKWRRSSTIRYWQERAIYLIWLPPRWQPACV